jgi:iron(III) transport system permease protein
MVTTTKERALPPPPISGSPIPWLTAEVERAWLPLLCSALVLGVVVSLLAFVVYMTFVPSLPTEFGFTLAHWGNLFSERFLTRVIPNTAAVGFGAIAVASGFALPMAWLLNRCELPFRETLGTLIAAVAVIPGYIITMGWIMLLDERIGLLNHGVRALTGADLPLSVSNSLAGIAWVLGLVLAPPIFFLVAGPLRSVDPALEEAASVSGARAWDIFWRIDVPLIWPGVLGAMLYVFMTAVSIFEIPALLGAASGKLPVLASEIFYAVRPAGITVPTFAYGAAGVYGLFLAVPSMLALYFYLRLLARSERYQVITGKGYRPREIDLGAFKYLGVLFVMLYLTLAVLLPLLMLVWSSLSPVLQMPSAEALAKLTTQNYEGLLAKIGGPKVLLNTVALVVSVSLLVTTFMVSWVVVRTQLRYRGVLDALAMLPHAIPGLAYAFALGMLGIIATKWMPWLPLAGTLVIIAIAHVVNRLPYGTRVTNSALLQVHKELEESAQMSGANNTTVMWRILLPLIKPSAIYLAMWTVLLSLQEVSMALFLSGPGNRVLSVSIFELWQGGNPGSAAAGSVVLVVALGTLVYPLLRLAAAGPGRALSRVAGPSGYRST